MEHSPSLPTGYNRFSILSTKYGNTRFRRMRDQYLSYLVWTNLSYLSGTYYSATIENTFLSGYFSRFHIISQFFLLITGAFLLWKTVTKAYSSFLSIFQHFSKQMWFSNNSALQTRKISSSASTLVRCQSSDIDALATVSTIKNIQ